MLTIARYAAGGLVVGFLATALTILVLPHFYSFVYELLIFPVIFVVVGVVVGVAAAAIKAVRVGSGRTTGSAFGRAFLVVIGASVVLCFALYAMRTPARAWKVSPKLVVMCIDGGTWDIIDPLVGAGRLPNLARLKKDGTAGVLMSTDPSFSLVVWTTIGTGVHPEKHGVTSFYDTQDHMQSKRIWEVFEDNGHSVGLFRWWITWPPRIMNGFVIPDILARDASSFPPKYNFINQFRSDQKSGHSTPASKKIATAWRFLRSGLRLETCRDIVSELLPAIRSGGNADRHIALRRAEIRMNADVYCHLLREIQPEFTCFYDNGADAMCHFYWQYYQPHIFPHVDPEAASRYGNAIPDYYVLHDAVIGRILEHVDPAATVAVLSDHGFAADTAGIHNWFFTRGDPILSDLGMDDEYYSVALASQTFIEPIRRDPTEKRAALERAVDSFNSVVVQESGVSVFTASITDEESILLGVSDSLQSLEGHVETSNGSVPLGKWFTTRAFTGTHHPEGIYIVKGPAFRRERAGAQAQLVDIAPTLLYTAGFPLSRELDGLVMWDWIADAFRNEHEVSWIDTYGRYDPLRRDVVLDEETKKKLRSLGYVR
jgi:predicted AlkP superfamily phosphohydrolase/phosphomutase